MCVEDSFFVFDQVVEQVDWHEEEGDDQGGYDETGAEIDAFAGVVDLGAVVARFELGFLVGFG